MAPSSPAGSAGNGGRKDTLSAALAGKGGGGALRAPRHSAILYYACRPATYDHSGQCKIDLLFRHFCAENLEFRRDKCFQLRDSLRIQFFFFCVKFLVIVRD